MRRRCQRAVQNVLDHQQFQLLQGIDKFLRRRMENLPLSHLYKLVRYSTTGEYGAINRRTVSLAAQVQECLGLPMFKGQDIRASDWSQPLGMQQIECK